MDITPLIRQLALLSNDLNSSGLRPGSRLEIQIKADQGGNQLTVVLGGKEMVATSENTLTPGRYIVEVQSTTPQLTLKLLSQSPQPFFPKPVLTPLPPFLDTNASVIRQPLPLPMFHTDTRGGTPMAQVPIIQSQPAQTKPVQGLTVKTAMTQMQTAQTPSNQIPLGQPTTVQTPRFQLIQSPFVVASSHQMPFPVLGSSIPLPAATPVLPFPAEEVMTTIGRPLEQAILDLSPLAREATAIQRGEASENQSISNRLDWKNLQNVIVNSGLFMERRLLSGEKGVEDDLKIKLLKLVRKFSESEQLIGALTRKINFLTKEQLANLVLKENGIFLIDIPLPSDREFRQIKIRYRKRGKNSPELKSDILSVYVNMTRLGEVKANVFLARDSIRIALFAQQPQTLSLLEKTSSLLAQVIRHETGKEVHIRCVLAEIHVYAEFDENLVLLEAMREVGSRREDG